MKLHNPKFKKELHWLLKDKYFFDEIKSNFLVEKVLSNELLPEEFSSEITKDIERLKKGEPLNYIIGYVDFLSCRIEVNKSVLIPRTETEYWVGELIKKLKDSKAKKSKMEILDLCCGSGCIGISVLKHIPDSKVTFVDISTKALNQTSANLKTNNIKSTRYSLVKSDLFNKVEQNFDLILCNPPYVSISENNLDLKWEPRLALYAEDAGLRVIEKVIKDSSNYLNKKGQLYLEFGKGQEKYIEKFLEEEFFAFYSFHKDQYGIYRYVEVS